MFTNNYIVFRNNQFFKTNANSFDTGFLKDKMTTPTGEVKRLFHNNTLYTEDLGTYMFKCQCRTLRTTSMSSNSVYFPEGGVYFGTGSTPATKEDYCLESIIESGLTVTSPSERIIRDDGNGRYTLEAPFMLTNTTEAEINIWELGCFVPTHVGSDDFRFILMERTVLTEPVTIAPGETKLVTYKLTFNQLA